MKKALLVLFIMLFCNCYRAYCGDDRMPSKFSKEDFEFYTRINTNDGQACATVDSLICQTGDALETDTIIAKYAYFSDGALGEVMSELVDKAVRTRRGFVLNCYESKYFRGIEDALYAHIILEGDSSMPFDELLDRYLKSLPSTMSKKEKGLLKTSLTNYHKDLSHP